MMPSLSLRKRMKLINCEIYKSHCLDLCFLFFVFFLFVCVCVCVVFFFFFFFKNWL
jgi:hypothetical protein